MGKSINIHFPVLKQKDNSLDEIKNEKLMAVLFQEKTK